MEFWSATPVETISTFETVLASFSSRHRSRSGPGRPAPAQKTRLNQTARVWRRNRRHRCAGYPGVSVQRAHLRYWVVAKCFPAQARAELPTDCSREKLTLASATGLSAASVTRKNTSADSDRSDAEPVPRIAISVAVGLLLVKPNQFTLHRCDTDRPLRLSTG